MKRFTLLVLTPGLLACVVTLANAQNLLTNGNMNSRSITTQQLATPTGYVATSNHLNPDTFLSDGLSSEGFANLTALDPGPGDCGSTPGCGVFYKTFRGEAPSEGDFRLSASLHQDVAATPGLKYTLTGWIAAGPGYSGEDDANNTLTEFGIEFLDAGGGVIGGDILSLGAAELTQVTGNVREYAQYMAMAVAPAGATSVRSRLSISNAWNVPGAGDAALVTDLWELTAIPEPTSLALAGLSLVGLLGMRRR